MVEIPPADPEYPDGESPLPGLVLGLAVYQGPVWGVCLADRRGPVLAPDA